MKWLYLILAGVCEIGWPLGLKMSSMGGASNKWFWTIVATVAIAVSGWLLFLAQKTIPIGTAYAVWTGIGTVGTFIVGIIYFKDPATVMRIVSAILIVVGIIGLKLSAH